MRLIDRSLLMLWCLPPLFVDDL